jgi:hypothetical protein
MPATNVVDDGSKMSSKKELQRSEPCKGKLPIFPIVRPDIALEIPPEVMHDLQDLSK